MSRRLRHLLEDGPWVVEITTRAIQGRFLTRPSPELNETVIGVLGRAQALYLVEHPFEWPSVHCAKALACGEDLHGYWYDRTKEYIAGRRGKELPRSDLVEKHSVRLEPLPCWRHLEEEERQELVARLIDEVVEEAAVRRKKSGLRCLGVKAIKAQRPHDRPKNVNRSDAPDFHVSDPEVGKTLRDGYDNFVKKFRLAAQELRAGNRLTAFPEDCFPPGLPYVPYARGDPLR